MAINEFDIIRDYFSKQTLEREDVLLGIGDDAAVIQPTEGQQLLVATDTLLQDVHFQLDWPASAIAYRALAVNLSDFAAMGAEPTYFTLNLSLMDSDETWLNDFSQSLFKLADKFNVQLIGGDLTHGPMTIAITVLGYGKQDKLLRRDAAKVDDLIYVTGDLGAAGLALQQLKANGIAAVEASLLARLLEPPVRINAGLAAAKIAHAAIDISDGLLADLQHILNKSGVGAELWLDKIPVSVPVQQSLNPDEALRLALTAGDDYELCITLPKSTQESFETAVAAHCQSTLIGCITEGSELICKNEDGKTITFEHLGYQHF